MRHVAARPAALRQALAARANMTAQTDRAFAMRQHSRLRRIILLAGGALCRAFRRPSCVVHPADRRDRGRSRPTAPTRARAISPRPAGCTRRRANRAAATSRSTPGSTAAHFDFMVDTGASLVILRESRRRAWPASIRCRATTPPPSPPPTARSRPRRAKLDRIEVGGITVYDVAALVLPDEALGQNLLGVSFLSRLQALRSTPTAGMVLEQ